MSVRLARLWVAMALLFLAAGVAYPLFPRYMSSRGLDSVEIGAVASTSALASTAAAVLLGFYSDSIGRREALQAAVCAALAGLMPVYSLAEGFGWFLFLHSAFTSLGGTAMALSGAVAMDYITDRRGARFGALRTSGAVGWVAGTLAGGYLVERAGYQMVFAASSLAYAAAALLYGLGARRARQTAAGHAALTPLGWSAVLLLAAVFVASVSNPAYYTFTPLYIVQELGGSELEASLAFAVTPFAEIPAMIALGALSDRVGRFKVLAACLLAFPLRYSLTGLLKDPASVIAVQLLHGLTFAGLYVVGSAYLADTAGGATGFALSLFTAAFNLGGVAGGYLLALVQARYGYTSMYLAAAALSTLSLPLLLASAMLGSRPRATR